MSGIRLGLYSISAFKLGGADVKVYLGDTKLYPSGNEPCFEVVDALSAATGSYIDVYNTTDSKWYKKNNLSQYEEYGVMPEVDALSGVTYYVGKKVILSTDSHEYKWNGTQWSDVGELIDVYTEYEYVQGNGTSYINTGYYPKDNTIIELENSGRQASSITSQDGSSWPGGCATTNSNNTKIKQCGILYPGAGTSGIGGIRFDYRDGTYHNNSNQKIIQRAVIKMDSSGGYIDDTKLVTFSNGSSTLEPNNCPFALFTRSLYSESTSEVTYDAAVYGGKVYSVKFYEGDTLVRNYVPATKNDVVGMYETVNGVMYGSEVSTPFTVGGSSEVHGSAPEPYDTKVAPPDNVVYSTLAELELMECPWIGMHATVGGVPYIYTVNGWVHDGQLPCFEVVDALSAATGSYVDVYNTTDSKWYKKNNLSQYEEYGVMPTVDSLNVTSILPDGYTELDYVENSGSSSVNLGIQLFNTPGASFEVVSKNEPVYTSGGGNYQSFIACQKEVSPYPGFTYRFDNNGTLEVSNNTSAAFTSSITSASGSTYDVTAKLLSVPSHIVNDYPLVLFSGLDDTKTPFRFCKGKIYSLTVKYNDTLVRNLVPAKRNSDNVAGLYDTINSVFYTSSNEHPLVSGNEISTLTYYTGKLVILSTDNHEYKWDGSAWTDLGDARKQYVFLDKATSSSSMYSVKYKYHFGDGYKLKVLFKLNDSNYPSDYNLVDPRVDSSTCTSPFKLDLYSKGYYCDSHYPLSSSSNECHSSSYSSRNLQANAFSSYANKWILADITINKTVFYDYLTGANLHQKGSVSSIGNWYDGLYEAACSLTADCPASLSNIRILDANGNVINDLQATVVDGNGAYYDSVLDVYYTNVNSGTTVPYHTEYSTEIDAPVEYDTKVAPADYVTYSTLAELELMECPWIGMHATVGNEEYIYTSNGWVVDYELPCFEVVDALSAATGSYVDVYNTTDSKWYKKNNLSQYEEYGIMPEVTDLSTLTYYTGKLAVNTTDNHEYKWNGSSWTDLGAMIDAYTEYEYVQGNGTSYILTDYIPKDNTCIEADILGHSHDEQIFGALNYWSTTGSAAKRCRVQYGQSSHIRYDFGDNRIDLYQSGLSNRIAIKLDNTGGYLNGTKIANFTSSTAVTGCESVLGIFCAAAWDYDTNTQILQTGIFKYSGKIYSLKIYEGETLVRNFVPATKNGSVGFYDTVNKVLWDSEVSTPFTVGGNSTEHGSVPEEYDTKVAPPDNVVYSTLEELELMECPWIGMHATVGGVHYIYTVNGWEETLTPFINVDLVGGSWSRDDYSSLSDYYRYSSSNVKTMQNNYKLMKVEWIGIPNFSIFINSNSYAPLAQYMVVTDMDVDMPTSRLYYNSTGVKDSTYNTSNSQYSIDGYKEVSYPNDGGKHHLWAMYRQDNGNNTASYANKGFLLISKEYNFYPDYYYLWHFNGVPSGNDNCIQFSEFDLVDSATGQDLPLSFVSSNMTGFSNEVTANLFDNDVTTKFCQGSVNSTLISNNYIVFKANVTMPFTPSPTTFSMTTANDSANCKRWASSWDLYTSNTSTTDWTDGSWTKILSGTGGSEMQVNYTRFDYPIA